MAEVKYIQCPNCKQKKLGLIQSVHHQRIRLAVPVLIAVNAIPLSTVREQSRHLKVR